MSAEVCLVSNQNNNNNNNSSKKPRRSSRLVVKEMEDNRVSMIQNGPLGYFNILPLELRFYLLNFLTIDDLSILTITSKIMRNLVEGYRITQPVTQHVTPHPHINTHLIQTVDKLGSFYHKYKKLGLLIKRSTCLYSTKDRLKLINDFLTKMMCCNAESVHDAEYCISLTCFGKFLHTVIAGWDDSECQKAFDSICQHTALLKNIKTVVNSRPGLYPGIENGIRLLIRRVFLDSCPSDRAFWLTRILKPWPMVTQARIIYLLYGAAYQGEIFWLEMCENTPSTSEQSVQHFSEIADSIQLLYNYKTEWSEDDIISVVDELTSSPDEWLAENVANLLLLCGDKITAKLLISKAINGRIIELCSITTSFCLVCVKSNYSLSCVMIMIQNILQVMDNSKDRLQFINSMMDMFKEMILDMHEFSESDEIHDSDLFYLVTALTEFTKRTVQMAFKNIIT